MRYFLLILGFILSSHVIRISGQTSIQPGRGSLHRLDSLHSKYIDDRPVDIWLPSGYSESKKYSVIYMHDGQNLFDTLIHGVKGRDEWRIDESLDDLIQKGKIEACIVVGIWSGKKRRCEFFPEKPFNALADSVQMHIEEDFSCTINSENYLRYIIEELKPFIDQHYATYTDRSHTFIGGSSMGGLASLYALCEYPDIFGGAVCISTHWIGCPRYRNDAIPKSMITYLREHLPPPGNHRIYMDHGTLGYDALYRPWQEEVDHLLRAHGYKKKQLRSLVFQGSDHNESAWQQRAGAAIHFVMGGSKRKN